MIRTLLLTFVAAGAAFAQATFGTVTGVVRDNTGAVILNAKVKVVNQETGISRQVVTEASGNYEVTHLNPGRYTVEAESAGFKTHLSQNVDLRALQTVRVDIALELGDLSTRVVVTSGAPVIETDVSGISAVQTSRQYTDLPIRTTSNISTTGKSGVFDYLTVVPTAYVTGGAGFSIAGTTATQNSMNVDGISSNSTQTGGPAGTLEPGMDAIQEVLFDMVNNRAEFGEVVTITTITKSGANDFHGGVFYFNANRALTSRDFFAVVKGNNIRNNYGTSVGGPFKRNKAFFFIAYEGERNTLPATVTSNQPTLKMRQGDFSELLTGAQPITIRDPLTNAPFADNRIPAARITAGALNWQNKFFPTPNFGASNLLVGNFRGVYPQNILHDQFDIRADYNFSQGHSMYARVGYKRNEPRILDGDLPPVNVDGYRVQIRSGRQAMISDTWSINPRLVNEFKVGFGRDYIPRRGNLIGADLVQLLGVQGAPSSSRDSYHPPVVAIIGFSTVADPGDEAPASNVFHFVDQLTWIRGAHTIKGGGEFAPQQFNNLDLPTFGNYNFTNRFSGYAYSDYLLGLPTTTARKTPGLPQASRYWFLNGFVQDDWKVSARLTLYYGVRYAYNRPVVDKYDNIANFDLATGGLVVPTDAVLIDRISPVFPKAIPLETAASAGFPGRALRNGDTNNFQPRFGFAYRPGNDNRTVIRGGYGIFNDDLSGAAMRNLYGGPFSVSESFTNSITNGVPLLTLNRPFLQVGALGAINVTGLSVNTRNPYVQQMNLTIERDLGFHTGLRVSYMRTKSVNLLYTRNINQPPASNVPANATRRTYPAYNSITYIENGANQVYDALTVDVQRKWSAGLSFQTAWTWAKNLTEISDSGVSESNNTIENSFDRSRERGNAAFNPRHRAVGNVIWELPVGPGKPLFNRKGVAGQIAGGWQLSATLVTSTGEWLTPSFSGSDPSNTNTVGGRPDQVANANLPSDQRSINRWFDAAAFKVPPSGRFGNSARGVIEGPGRFVFNLGGYRTFRIAEKASLRFQATFTNALNHPNFANPAPNISTAATVGTIRATMLNDLAGARTGLLGVRINF